MPIIPTESEVLHMKKTHGLDEREMELVKLLMADCQTTGDIQAKLKKLFAGTIEQMLEAQNAQTPPWHDYAQRGFYETCGLSYPRPVEIPEKRRFFGAVARGES